jgi:uncharacterized protein YggL (DUF469 family)
MNKRLRKKLHRKEFKEIGFDFRICFDPVYDDEKFLDMIDNICCLIEQHGFIPGGGCERECYEGYMSVLSWRISADEMKEKLQTALQEFPEITSVEFGKNTDAWYGPFSE